MTSGIVITDPRTVYSVFFPAGGASQQLVNGDGRIHGWCWVETTGVAPATVELYDGSNTGGNYLATITLTAGQSTRDFFNELGLQTVTGLFVNIVAGSVRGAIYYEDT